jgi:hypothetical protein
MGMQEVQKMQKVCLRRLDHSLRHFLHFLHFLQAHLGYRGRTSMGADLVARRRNLAARQWRRSERGSWFVNARGFNVVVFGSRKGWGIRIEQRYETATSSASSASPPPPRPRPRPGLSRR